MLKKTRARDGTEIAYDVRKGRSGRFLVFLHGLGGNLTAWEKQVRYFRRRGLSTVAIDLRGHGMSGKPDNFEAYSFDRFAGDVAAVLTEERIKEFVLVGHCFGGIVAMACAGRGRLKPKGYILIATTYKTPVQFTFARNPQVFSILRSAVDRLPAGKRETARRDMKMFRGTFDIDPFRLYTDIIETSPKAWLYSIGQMIWLDKSRELKGIKEPVLVMEGGRDIILGREIGEGIRKSLRRQTSDIIPDANHILNINNSREVSEGIQDYLLSIGFA